MIRQYQPPVIILVILVLSLINSFDLFKSWTDSPIEMISWLLFFIWLLPLPIEWFESSQVARNFSTQNSILASLALFAGLISVVGSLNALAYAGLALAVVACLPWSSAHIAWLGSSIAWMPALGWYLAHQFPTSKPLVPQLIRLGIVAIGVLWTVFSKNNHKEIADG